MCVMIKRIVFGIILCIFQNNLLAQERVEPVIAMGSKDIVDCGEYTFKRVFNSRKLEGTVWLEIWFKGKMIFDTNGNSCGDINKDRNWNYIDVYKMFPGDSSQVLIYCSGGGKDYTGSYCVYNLGSNGKIAKLFDSDDYMLRGYYSLISIKGIESLVIEDEAEPWLDLISIASETPRVKERFLYNRKKRCYLPSNHITPPSKEPDTSTFYELDKDTLRILLSWASEYWFCGKEKEGWEVFDNFYNDKDKNILRQNIHEILANEPYIKNLILMNNSKSNASFVNSLWEKSMNNHFWYTPKGALILNIIAGIITALIAYFFGYYVAKYGMNRKRKKFFKYLGEDAVLRQNTYIVCDLLRNTQPPSNNGRYFKFDIRQTINGPNEVVGDCIPRSIKYIASMFAHVTEIPEPIVEFDTNILERWEANLICLGSSASNVKTQQALQQETNVFCRFGQDEESPFIEWLPTGTRYRNNELNIDRGIIVKMRNPYFPEKWVVICAGLNVFGTSGAVYYFSRNWETLYRRFGQNEFCILLNVNPPSDESAREMLHFRRP